MTPFDILGLVAVVWVLVFALLWFYVIRKAPTDPGFEYQITLGEKMIENNANVSVTIGQDLDFSVAVHDANGQPISGAGITNVVLSLSNAKRPDGTDLNQLAFATLTNNPQPTPDECKFGSMVGATADLSAVVDTIYALDGGGSETASETLTFHLTLTDDPAAGAQISAMFKPHEITTQVQPVGGPTNQQGTPVGEQSSPLQEGGEPSSQATSQQTAGGQNTGTSGTSSNPQEINTGSGDGNSENTMASNTGSGNEEVPQPTTATVPND